MPSRKELEDQMAALQSQLDAAGDDEDDYEIWVKNDKGHETKIPSKKASGWVKENFGISLHEDAPPAGDLATDPAGDPAGDPPGDPKPGGAGYFNRRKG
jgi:hypothetical protein